MNEKDTQNKEKTTHHLKQLEKETKEINICMSILNTLHKQLDNKKKEIDEYQKINKIFPSSNYQHGVCGCVEKEKHIWIHFVNVEYNNLNSYRNKHYKDMNKKQQKELQKLWNEYADIVVKIKILTLKLNNKLGMRNT